MNDETWQIVFSCLMLLIAVIFLIGVLLFVAKPIPPKKPKPVWHLVPTLRGDGRLPCCDHHPSEVPPTDMLTTDPRRVNCPAFAPTVRTG